MIETPFSHIKKSLSKKLPSRLVKILPDKWEKIGDVLIIKLPEELNAYSNEIGEKYSKVLGCKSVLNEVKGISGLFREPNVELIFGDKKTKTVHVENGVRFKLDPMKIMFSSGNMDERIRMANISNKNEVVVDLFAGIGYFSLPVAVYSKPKKVYACEINKVAYEYLRENVVLNEVSTIVEPILGDNRVVAPKNLADRVIMGYINETSDFLSTAINCLKNGKGIIHYHEVCPDELIPETCLVKAKINADKQGKKLELIDYKNIKSYAPGISHAVLDFKIGER
jgi:tRNA wybutosine-synthesizing protein 2